MADSLVFEKMERGVVRGDPDRTRKLLLAAARREFAEKGFDGARVDEIARRAGVNKQLVYYHFGNKDDLFRIALEQGYEDFRARDQDLDLDALPPLEAIERLVAVTFDDLLLNKDQLWMVMDENRLGGRHLVDRERIKASQQPLLDTLAKVLERGEKQGVFRSGLDPAQLHVSILALLIFYLSNNFTLSALLGRDLSSEAALVERKAHVVDFVVNALRR
jgi:TetR/AcrR family transcriptional regulator